MKPIFRMPLVIAGLLTPSSMGCNQTPREAQQHGTEAAKVAEASHDRLSAPNDACKRADEASANETIRDNHRAVIGREDNPRSWAQSKSDDVDTMIDSASVKAQTARPTATAQFSQGLQQVEREREALRAESTELEGSTGACLEESKERFSDHVDRVKSNIRNLERAL